MRSSRPAIAALSIALCLGAAACGTTSPVAGAAYGTTSAAAPTPMTSVSSSAAPMAPATTMLIVRKTTIGYVLATRTGQTVYWFGHDVKGSGKSACTGSCLTSWPVVAGTPVAAPGVRLAGKLGTITRPGGVVQATYNGYPLYTYVVDMTPGQTLGNDAGGVWHVITGAVLSPSPAAAAAASLRDVPASGATAPASSAPATSGSGGYGGGY